jgi:hypothetical protein
MTLPSLARICEPRDFVWLHSTHTSYLMWWLIPPSLPNVVKSQFKCGDQGQTPHLEKISKLERAEEWISDPQTENSLASSNQGQWKSRCIVISSTESWHRTQWKSSRCIPLLLIKFLELSLSLRISQKKNLMFPLTRSLPEPFENWLNLWVSWQRSVSLS